MKCFTAYQSIVITGNEFLGIEKNADTRIAYFFILGKIFDVQSDICDQMRKFFILYLPGFLRSD